MGADPERFNGSTAAHRAHDRWVDKAVHSETATNLQTYKAHDKNGTLRRANTHKKQQPQQNTWCVSMVSSILSGVFVLLGLMHLT